MAEFLRPSSNDTSVGRAPVISSEIGLRSRLGALAVHLGIDRDGHRFPAGLYAVGEPGAASPVVVTTNYALTYDHVRAALRGESVWLLVLETLGVNVWCAAGKGTFGTGELVARIQAVRLPDLVEHRRLLLTIGGGQIRHEELDTARVLCPDSEDGPRFGSWSRQSSGRWLG